MNNPRKPKIGDLILVNQGLLPVLVMEIKKIETWLSFTVLDIDGTLKSFFLPGDVDGFHKSSLYYWKFFDDDDDDDDER